MSWMSDLAATYDACESAAGIGDAEKALLPIGHTLMKTQICVTLNKDGNFIKAEENETKIIAPSTEEAEARTGGAIPYPLFEQIAYLIRDFDENKFIAYITGLQNWSNENTKLEAVLKYLKKETLLNDLNSLKLKSKNGLPDKALGVRFSVEIPGELTSELWQDRDLRKQWRSII
jgi:CRISPR-associated protein Csd1